LSQESNAVAPSNVFHVFIAFFHTSSSCQAHLLFFELDQEIPRDPQTSLSCTFLYVVDRKIQYKQSINVDRNNILQMSNYSFVDMNSLMHHPHQQRYHKINHTQAQRASLPVQLVRHTDIEDPGRSGMVNHPNPMTLIVLGHRANLTLDCK
jgi:hypothetical protein